MLDPMSDLAVVARFLAIGAASTLACALLYVALHPLLGATGADAAALALTAVGNTAANRCWSRHADGDRHPLRRAAGLGVPGAAQDSGSNTLCAVTASRFHPLMVTIV